MSSLIEKVTEFFSSNGDHPVDIIGGKEDQWELEDPPIQMWWEFKKPEIWQNNKLPKDPDYKD